jgi:hypothetical protein
VCTPNSLSLLSNINKVFDLFSLVRTRLSVILISVKEVSLKTSFVVLLFRVFEYFIPVVVVGKQWSENSDCVVKKSTVTLTTVECKRLVNKNLAIMSVSRYL